jgi:hypothetical protein
VLCPDRNACAERRSIPGSGIADALPVFQDMGSTPLRFSPRVRRGQRRVLVERATRVRGLLISVCAVLALAGGSGRAHAAGPERRLLLFDAGPLPVSADFRDSLRIQLAGLVTLVDGGPLPGATAAARQSEAVRRTREADAALAVWLEAGESPGHVLLSFVVPQGQRALVRVERISDGGERGGSPAELGRALALKVREVLEGVPPRPAPLPPPPTPPPPTPQGPQTPTPPARPTAPTSPAPPRVAALLEAGGLFFSGAGTVSLQGGFRAAGGMRLLAGRVAFDAVGLVHISSDLSAEKAGGRVNVSELDVGGGLSVGHRWSRLHLGGQVEAGARLLHGQGFSGGSPTGDAHRTVPWLYVGPGLGLRLWRWFELRASVGPELSFVLQRFAVAGVPVAELGRVRGRLGLSLLSVFP